MNDKDFKKAADVEAECVVSAGLPPDQRIEQLERELAQCREEQARAETDYNLGFNAAKADAPFEPGRNTWYARGYARIMPLMITKKRFDVAEAERRRLVAASWRQGEDVIACLNSAFELDPNAMHALIVNRVPCNLDLANHPHIAVEATQLLPEDHFQVGMFGVLMGVLNAAGMGMIATKWSEPDVTGRRLLLGFCEYKPPAGEQSTSP